VLASTSTPKRFVLTILFSEANSAESDSPEVGEAPVVRRQVPRHGRTSSSLTAMVLLE
jgi:hypothetical protein